MKGNSSKVWFISLLIGAIMLAGMIGCEIGPASGTLQVFYSGNLTASMEPCG